MEPLYLDVEDLLHITELEDIGPVRDLGLLDSAAARPRSSTFGLDAYPTLPEKAAALLDSIIGRFGLPPSWVRYPDGRAPFAAAVTAAPRSISWNGLQPRC